MNPIEVILTQVFHAVHRIPLEARGALFVMGVGLIVMLYAVSRKNLLGGKDRADMKIWPRMSATMNDRIAQLMPHFAASMNMLAQRYGEALQTDPNMVTFIKSIDGSVKEKAEIDYCLRDCEDDSAVADLAHKLETLLKPENNA